MRLLLIDTCGENGSLALAENDTVLRERALAARAASAHLVGAIRQELAELSWPLRTLHAVCVVNGPGSFTGVRVGLAAGKGLCDVAGVRLVTLSRLKVLLRAGGIDADAWAVLDAGREEFYVHSGKEVQERLLGRDELLRVAAGKPVLIAEERLLARLDTLACTLVGLSAANALPLALERLQQGSDSVETTDASYVREARALYTAGSPRAEPTVSA